MIKNIYTSILCVLLITVILQINIVFAGDEDNPEIEDDIGDVPFSFIDIVSAWFFEDPEDPDYLYTAIKVQNLQYKSMITGYSILWRYKGSIYNILYIIWSQGDKSICYAGVLGGNLNTVVGSCDLENDIIAMKIPKRVIENPKPGDVLEKPFAHTIFTPLASLLETFQIYIFSDYAPNNLQGRNYIIQY
jgi:hypothetical protein